MNAKTAGARRRAVDGKETEGRPLNWPDDPENVTAADIDFGALAHVLANTCRRGGCCRHYHSVAAHAAIVSEEIAALDGLGDEDRRTLALHALLVGAASAWFRGAWFRGESAGSARAADRTARLAAGIEAAVREAAGLDTVLDEEHAELLRFVERMTVAAERRDLFGAEDLPGIGFPPLKRRIRSIPPDRAAEAWLKRFREGSASPWSCAVSRRAACGRPSSASETGSALQRPGSLSIRACSACSASNACPPWWSCRVAYRPARTGAVPTTPRRPMTG